MPTAVDSETKSPRLLSTRSCPVTMPGNATPGNASTPNSRSAVSRAAFNFGSSPGAPRAMRNTVGASASVFATPPVDTSGSGSRICGRAVVSCDVAKSALTPTIVNSCSRLSSSVTVTRWPIGSVAGNSCSASGSEITATGAAMMRSSAVMVRPRSSGAPIVSRKFSPTRVTCAVTNFASIRAGDAKHSVVEVNRHAFGHGNRANAAGLLEIVANLPDGKAGLALRSDARRQTRGRQSIGVKAQLGRPHPVEHHAADDEKRYGDADLNKRCHAMHANRLASPTAGILLQRMNQVGTAEANGRQQSEEHAHEQAQSGRDRDTGRVQIDLRGNRRAQPPSSHGRNAEQHERAERAGDKRQQDRFEEQMPDETSPARAERRADGQLALTVGAANQHHARDVQAHDQEHRSRQAEDDADRAPRLRTAGRTQRDVRLDCRRLEFIRCGIPLLPNQRPSPKPAQFARVMSTPGSSRPWIRTQSTVLSSRRFGFARRRGCRSREMNTQGTRRLKEVEVATKSRRGVIPTTVCGNAIDRHGFPDDVGIGCHAAPPEVMAQDDARLGRRRIVDGSDQSPVRARAIRRTC